MVSSKFRLAFIVLISNFKISKIKTYWWAIVLVFLGFLLVLGLIGFLIFKCTEHQHPWKVEAKKNAKEAEKNVSYSLHYLFYKLIFLELSKIKNLI